LDIECVLREGYSEYHQPDPPPATTNARQGAGVEVHRMSNGQPRDFECFLDATAFDFDDEDFLALAFDLDDEAFFALAFEWLLREECADECDDLPRRLRAECERRATCSGRFHPTARSARNDAGMLSMP
jgi:hypothetical protein